MPRLDGNHTGARIREQRKLARLTQRQLAERIPYSYSLLNQVECGAKPANLDFIAALARALRVDVWCAAPLSNAAAHDLGPRTVNAHGSAARWFPRCCPTCWKNHS